MHLSKLYHLNIYSFLVTIHIAFIVYIGSTFLSGIFGQDNIWIIYTLSAFFTLVLNFSVTPLLRNFHIEKINNLVLLIAGANLISLTYTTYPATIFISYILYIALSGYLVLLASIMIEDLSRNSVTGSIRGNFITMQSLAYILSPFLTSFAIKYFGLNSIFLISGIFIFISLIYFKLYVKSIPQISIHDKKFIEGFKKIWRNYDLKISIFTFTSMYIYIIGAVVYIPFKMSQVGIPLGTYLSVLLPIALIPFVIVPTILGYIEDKMKDEKQFMQLGLFGLICILAAFALVNSSNIFVWAILLFLARVFGSVVETSVNSYFFKKIDKSDTAIMSIFQSSEQIAYLFFSPVLSLILIYGNLQTVFLSISFFLAFTIVLVSKIHNTDNYEKHKTLAQIFHRSKRRVSN